MKTRKLLALATAFLLVFSLMASCATATPSAGGDTNSPGGGNDTNSPVGGETVELLVWGPLEDQDFLKEVETRFQAAHPENIYKFTYGVVTEGDVKARLAEDPEAGADVFVFPDDQLRDMVNAGMLYEITRNVSDVQSRNLESSVEIATLDGKLWAYPEAADNGYFLYYDKSMLSEDDVKSLDSILAKCAELGKKFTYDVSNGWLIASWFLANGNIGLDADGKQTCDFNNANGVAAGEAMRAMVEHEAWIPGWDAELNAGIGDTIAAGLGGTWMAETVKEKLGDNYGATKLPTATIGGQQVQLSSFMGCKLEGVNSQTKVPVHAMDYADFITSEEIQLLHFEMRGIGPSNKNVAESAAVKENIALAALAQQAAHAYPQRDVLGSYWDPAAAFGTAMINKDTTPIQDLLDAMIAQIVA